MKKINLLILISISLISNAMSATCDKYWVGGGSSATWAATGNTNWGSASNTQDNAAVPSSTDNVCFDGVGTGNSASTVGATTAVNDLNFTGYANTLTHNGSVTLTVNGNLTLSTGMTYSGSGSTSTIAMESTTTGKTITTAGKTLKSLFFGNVGPSSSGGWTLQDNVTTTNTFAPLRGTLNTNSKSISAGAFTSNVGGVFTACGSAITLPSTGAILTVTSHTFTACPGNPWTIAITDTSASSKTFAGGGFTYPSLTVTGGGAGAVIFSGANTFTSATLGSPKTYTWPSSITNTFGSLSCTGTAGNLISFNSSTPGTQATLLQKTGRVSCDYLDLTDSATTWVPFYAGSHSNNTSNNSGWIFSDAPTIVNQKRLYRYGSS